MGELGHLLPGFRRHISLSSINLNDAFLFAQAVADTRANTRIKLQRITSDASCAYIWQCQSPKLARKAISLTRVIISVKSPDPTGFLRLEFDHGYLSTKIDIYRAPVVTYLHAAKISLGKLVTRGTHVIPIKFAWENLIPDARSLCPNMVWFRLKILFERFASCFGSRYSSWHMYVSKYIWSLFIANLDSDVDQ